MRRTAFANRWHGHSSKLILFCRFIKASWIFHFLKSLFLACLPAQKSPESWKLVMLMTPNFSLSQFRIHRWLPTVLTIKIKIPKEAHKACLAPAPPVFFGQVWGQQSAQSAGNKGCISCGGLENYNKADLKSLLIITMSLHPKQCQR